MRTGGESVVSTAEGFPRSSGGPETKRVRSGAVGDSGNVLGVLSVAPGFPHERKLYLLAEAPSSHWPGGPNSVVVWPL